MLCRFHFSGLLSSADIPLPSNKAAGTIFANILWKVRAHNVSDKESFGEA